MKTEPMRTLTISLSPQQVARLHDAVESGAYASNSEVVRDALRLWEQREEIRLLEINRLKRAYDEGMASGEGREVDAKTLLAELKAEIRRGG
ncbi:type II toxin-antitoxin system ParD family antitoxin [Agrobacterium rhizogenes]|uniref:Addiction module antidote protein n=2 Tax=Rhizobium/Agrobacterium group TaxID=227290 RepID=A0AA87U852_RHIRH|nr:type II toxin-antitoxin system ParD family antitoxin [Rhizobium lusitanum]NTF58066.1 type II toxin-antitoxin system ParD family antitoxin [Rhizobium rhizogenes]GAJ96700.1 putative addiction module antidote protein [Rhizobium rhizogenes NBRC 13257]NTF64485.1 type II toxin-antitoxin system ParD family antitoxin [Rhizobium rhizogenes]NTF77648.1 type II toxin-antitoxin system ParD family antitoxin [Rhizobium rhizogenes]NTF89878.1 type II toxin-antitoxin system ParD family antitoxin [Rhizobium r